MSGKPTGERSARSESCGHRGLAAVERTEGGYRLRCGSCGEIGPTRKTAEAARKALLVLGARASLAAPGAVGRAREAQGTPTNGSPRRSGD